MMQVLEQNIQFITFGYNHFNLLGRNHILPFNHTGMKGNSENMIELNLSIGRS